MVNPSLREPKQILSRSEEESEEFPKSKKRKDDFMSSDKLAEGPKSSDYGFDYEIEGEYYVFKDKSNSIKYMTPDDFHYFYGKKTKEEQFEDNYDERDEEFENEEDFDDYDISNWKIKDEDQPKPIKTKFSDGDFILQAMEETMLKRRSPRGGKGKESEDISTLEELSSDVPKWKSADANDDSEDD
ncbi:uncharacterized protein [Medicago truncatula]|uniref:uncharacterized protein isoform X2 n=1 Tax=Medicago truncatula TaxID=3880 RepID=UPI00196888FD|nr:uncharacterized protein LOC112421396 isoform X2 [Medicago truncatula]